MAKFSTARLLFPSLLSASALSAGLSLQGCAAVSVVGSVASAGASVASAGVGAATTIGGVAVSGAGAVASAGVNAMSSNENDSKRAPRDARDDDDEN
jgi:hypothetical protein